MVNVFPTLISFAAVAPLLLRVTLGVTLIVFGLQMVRQKRIGLTAYFEANSYPLATAALTTFYVLLNMMYIERRDERLFAFTQPAYFFLLIIATSILFSGAGLWSFDLTI
jgi:uncharacterized membrane protein YphA (DoxX/SURF4 family)